MNTPLPPLTPPQINVILALGQGKDINVRIQTVNALKRLGLVEVNTHGIIYLTEKGKTTYVCLMTEAALVPDFDMPISAHVASLMARAPMVVGMIESPDEAIMRRQIEFALVDVLNPNATYTLSELVSILCARHKALEAEARFYQAETARVTNCF